MDRDIRTVPGAKNHQERGREHERLRQSRGAALPISLQRLTSEKAIHGLPVFSENDCPGLKNSGKKKTLLVRHGKAWLSCENHVKRFPDLVGGP
jgi:hypothetical protein